jgi:membrane-bound lytic murein transglycosylase B
LIDWTVARPVAVFGLVFAAASAVLASQADFSHWLGELAVEAQERGISRSVIETALNGVQPLPDVIALDRNQPEGTDDLCVYLNRRLSKTRIERGRRMLSEHRDLLERVTATYGVPSRFLIALWGLETNFGDITGTFPVIDAVATLAHDDRRGPLFREQLFAALRIVDQGHRTPSQMTGSWAGGMGQVQLMPTTFLDHAVDYDGDGRKNIWSSLPDAFASAATYLKRMGWRTGEIWGREVRLPAELAGDRAELAKTRSVANWRSAGVTRIDGHALPGAEMRGSIVLPDRKKQHAFLVYSNFETLMRWNRSTFFAISVGALADEISQSASLRACRS